MVTSVVVASGVLVTTVVVTSSVDVWAVVIGALVVVKRTVVASAVVGASVKYKASTCIRKIGMIQKRNRQVRKVLVSRCKRKLPIN